jgi:hypothetical protein
MTWDAVFSAPDIQAGDQPVEVLRLLGRLEYAITADIWRLLYAPLGLTRQTTWTHLNALYEQQLVWRQKTSLRPRTRATRAGPPVVIDARQRQASTPLQIPFVWGLTPEGREYLALAEAEPDAAILAGLHVRDRRDPKVPLRTLTHDLQASWWCCGVIQEVVRCPYLHDIFVQVEYVSLTQAQRADDGAGQRIDALVGLRFGDTPLPLSQRPRPGTIPWDEGFQMEKGQWWEWFALEVDRGTEALKVLLGKATVYRDMWEGRVYQTRLKGNLLPVFLVPTKRRAGQIAREWQDAWPNGQGVIAPVSEATHPQHGPLWGRYTLLWDGRIARPLLQKWTLEAWRGLVKGGSL